MSTATPRHILVPHDFSDTAQNALSFAIELASKLGASITVMHAYELPAYTYMDGIVVTADFMSSLERAAQNALDNVVAAARRPALEVRGCLRRGPAWAEIDAYAKEAKADLIVIGTHARQGIAHALLGSVAEKVARTAPCPVLIVHGLAGSPP
jgi:nucleotide-binding universal stress UspA family protein